MINDKLQDNIRSICSASHEAFALRKQQNPSEHDSKLTILAATKGVPAATINQAAEYGITDIGENRVQELLAKYDQLNPQLNVHFIGKLQTNKVKYIIDKVCLIHSVDSSRLAHEINRQAQKHNLVMNVLIEINIGAEETKSGILPAELPALLDEIEQMERVRVCGLMTMAPICEEKDDYLKYFRQTHQIHLDFFAKKAYNIEIGNNLSIQPPILSMGMSDSYLQAIECGANLVRVGSAIFKGI